jgi:hypothetical protein
MTINEYLTKFNSLSPFTVAFAPRLICKDGFSMFVNANQRAYCQPQSDVGPWTSVEISFPSSPVDSILPFVETFDYGDDETDQTQTIYGNVPIEIVDQLIESHGGIKNV